MLSAMSGADRTIFSALPTIRRPAGAVRFCSGLLRLYAFIMALVVLANVAYASSPPHLGQASPPSMMAASTPPDDPCRPDDGCARDCAQHCVSGAPAIAAPAIVALSPARDSGANVIARSDANLGGGDPLSPFHPPKLLAVA
jgi:hypothetical protein